MIKIIATINGKEERMLTTKQVTQRLGVSRQAVRKMINYGRVRAIRNNEFIDGYLIPLSDIKKLK